MRYKWLWIVVGALIVLYLLGPAPSGTDFKKDMPALSPTCPPWKNMLQIMKLYDKLKPGNEARIIWANDSAKQKTEYAIVYLHGFSASQAEGDPIHRNIAKEFGCNLYLSRLAEHGIDTTERDDQFYCGCVLGNLLNRRLLSAGSWVKK